MVGITEAEWAEAAGREEGQWERVCDGTASALQDERRGGVCKCPVPCAGPLKRFMMNCI